jgi:hypothetical protein
MDQEVIYCDLWPRERRLRLKWLLAVAFRAYCGVTWLSA